MAYNAIISGFLAQGVAASRPAAPNEATTTLSYYYATDTTTLSFYDWNTAAWVNVTTTSSTNVTQMALGSGANSSSAFAFKGNSFVPNQTMVVTSIFGTFTPVNGATYKGVLADLSSPSATAPTLGTVTTSSGVTITGTTKQCVEFPISSRTLTAGTGYVFMMGRTDSTTTYVMPIPAPSSVDFFPTLPGNLVYGCRLTSTGPVTTDALDTSSGASVPSFAIGIKWR